MEKKGFHFPQGCDLKKHSQGNFEVPMENIFAVCYGKARIMEMFLKTPTNTMEQLKKEFNLDEFSFNLVHEYLKLAPSQREKVRDFFYRVIESEENVLNIPQTPEEFEKQVILENELSDNAPSHSKETTILIKFS